MLIALISPKIIIIIITVIVILMETNNEDVVVVNKRQVRAISLYLNSTLNLAY